MTLNASIPVRFSPETTERLKVVSMRSGLTISKLVRQATEAYLEKIEASGNVSSDLRELPPNYTTGNPQPVGFDQKVADTSSKILRKVSCKIPKSK